MLLLAGRPMIEHVYARVRQARRLSRVVVLTDDERVAQAVEGFGGECQLTPPECASGTDRIAWAARGWSEAVVINVQGDEPLIEPAAVDLLAGHLGEHPEDPLATLAAPAEPSTLANPHVVKVVVDRRGYALYFSRAAIPYPRNPGAAPVRRHVGIYGYQRAALLDLAGLPPTPLEQNEGLEQLRALENGLAIRVLEVAEGARGVDTREDLLAVEEILAASDPSAHGRGV